MNRRPFQDSFYIPLGSLHPAGEKSGLVLWAHYSDATASLHRRMFGVRAGRVEETFLLES